MNIPMKYNPNRYILLIWLSIINPFCEEFYWRLIYNKINKT